MTTHRPPHDAPNTPGTPGTPAAYSPTFWATLLTPVLAAGAVVAHLLF